MCGICGVYDYKRGRAVPMEVLARMTEVIRHRGPDDEGFYLDGPVGLGFRRLSIIDIQGGRQPMFNEDKSLCLIFNGEIYNYRSLQKDLERAGHCFQTSSDTEVIVHAYEEYGRDAVNRLNGMFAFALWDQNAQRLFMARDRTGIKPMYYAETAQGLIFGSELKTILVHPDIERQIDPAALNQYLALEYVPTPRTIYRGVKKLPPGHMLTLENGRIQIDRYWDMHLEESEETGLRNLEDFVGQLREVLRDVVEKEMISDVPLGVLLSGGVDSSAVAAMMTEVSPGRVKSFSIAFEDKSFDESSHARLVADHLKTDHHEMILTSDKMLALVPRIAEFLDEPLGDSSIIPTYLLSQYTRQHVTVALGGDGGDELFGGYSTLQAHRLTDYYQRFLPGPVGRRLIPRLVNALPVSFNNISFDFKVRRFVAGQGLPPVERHHLWLGSFSKRERQLLLGSLAEDHGREVEEILYSHIEACRAKQTINQIMYCDMKLYLEGDILPKVDRASMANSLEVRVPLLNQKMLEFACRLPVDFKLRGLTTKYILRRAMAGRLPDSIVKRGKKGFNMPVAKWLTGPLLPLAEKMFAPDRLKREGFFNPAFVRELLDEHLAGRRDNRKLLWTLLVFELWHDKWGV